MKLSLGNLPSLKASAAANIVTPSYDPSLLIPGMVHIGVGNFHRSHLATYMNDLFDSSFEENHQWGIVGAGVLSFDDAKRKILQPQDWLQTLVERDADSVKASVIASMTDFLPVDFENKEQHCQLQDMLMNPSIRIVSLTVTEGGYFLCDGNFNRSDAAVQKDAENPDAPCTVFGMMAKAIKQRRDAGMEIFTIMSCDNIPHNGKVVKEVVSGFAELMYGSDFATWIEQNVAFPNSMVDRITPGTTPEMREFVAAEYGLEDSSPIFCEPFRQWVLEDNFPSGRPSWEKLESVSFVQDVAPYELMKIRILNGGHASLCYPAALLDLEYVHEATEHPVIGPFLDALEREEMIPTIPPVPSTSLSEYWELIGKRFSNPTICDTISRICFDGSSRQPKFIVPVARDALEANRKIEGLALVSALWCRYCQGTTESGKTIEPNDPQWDRLQLNANRAVEDPMAWLGMVDVYGKVGEDPLFVDAFREALETVMTLGVEEAMMEYSFAEVAATA